jgi:hypothetical protein
VGVPESVMLDAVVVVGHVDSDGEKDIPGGIEPETKHQV